MNKEILIKSAQSDRSVEVQNNGLNQILLIDKPIGWTSFDVVAKIRSLLRTGGTEKVRVGHAGTLDPFATGLLIVLTGSETKNQDKFMKLDKEYEATLKLGYVSDTGDPEGKIAPFFISTEAEESHKGSSSFIEPKPNEIKKVLKKFTGEIEQIPPVFSAIKINGKRAYKLARKGIEFEIPSRKVYIYKLEVLNYSWPNLSLRVKCSSGTYIRTLGKDIGEKLGVGAYLLDLRRTKIGDYDVKKAKKINDLFRKEQ